VLCSLHCKFDAADGLWLHRILATERDMDITATDWYRQDENTHADINRSRSWRSVIRILLCHWKLKYLANFSWNSSISSFLKILLEIFRGSREISCLHTDERSVFRGFIQGSCFKVATLCVYVRCHIKILNELKELHWYCDFLRTSQQHDSDMLCKGACDEVPKIATLNSWFYSDIRQLVPGLYTFLQTSYTKCTF
jgi:hypothetical protein